MNWLWGVAAGAALLWPGRLSGAFDGVPLDRVPEAVAIGAVFPLLWLLAASFLRSRTARVLIVLLLAVRVASSALLVQDGWCVRFDLPRPYAKDAIGAPHAWDLRADWRHADPSCSAIMTRSYADLHEFPAWFFNLPPPSDSWPDARDRPPGATVVMTVHGFVDGDAPGRPTIEQAPGADTVQLVDGRASTADERLAPGPHAIEVRTVLTGEQWRFVATWNGRDLWSSAVATVARPSARDRWIRRRAGWTPTALVALLLGAWLLYAAREYASGPLLAWTILASTALVLLVAADRADLARRAIAALALAAAVPVPARFRTWRGALLMIGVPWMAFAVACAAPAIGRFVLYEVGHDYWMFQRYAYRIVMQGYWLEGGSPTFWFQPLYRWIVGLLHVVFGDSSAGEWYWDAACLFAGALFAYRVVDDAAGFRWGIVAAAVVLATFTWGTAQYLIGRGLGEISSAGLVYTAALFAMRARHGRWRPALAAGALATLAFYTRLNNLVMAAGVAVFAMPAPGRPRREWREPALVVATVAAGVLMFAWRTWHYTGVFSIFYGTQRDLLATWRPGMPVMQGIRRMVESVLVVVSVNDPPRFDLFAVPVLAGTAVALLAASRVPRVRRVSPRLLLFFGSSIAGALVARGSAYPGRFSIHVMAIAVAIAACGAYALAHSATATRAPGST